MRVFQHEVWHDGHTMTVDVAIDKVFKGMRNELFDDVRDEVLEGDKVLEGLLQDASSSCSVTQGGGDATEELAEDGTDAVEVPHHTGCGTLQCCSRTAAA